MGQSKSKVYTISDISKICGVSVASISKYVKRNQLKPVTVGKNNSKYFSDTVLKEIKSYYQQKAEKRQFENEHKPVTKDDVINQLKARIEELQSTNQLLRDELSVKNQQIQSAIQIANQAQQLDLTTHQQKALPNDTVKTVDDEPKSDVDTTKKSGGILSWLRGR